MRIEDLFEKNFDFELEAERLVENAALQAQLRNAKDLEQDYEEIRLLHDAIKKKDFGILIGKKGKELTFNDVQEIKTWLHTMFRRNSFFSKKINNERDFETSVQRIGHKIEWLVLTAFSGIFALSTVVTGPLGVLFSAGSFLLGRRQKKLSDAIESATSVFNVAQSFSKFQEVDKGRARRIEKLVKDKNPKELKKAIKKDAQKFKKDISKNFLKDYKRLPDAIEYVDEAGNEKLYPIEKLFTF